MPFLTYSSLQLHRYGGLFTFSYEMYTLIRPKFNDQKQFLKISTNSEDLQGDISTPILMLKYTVCTVCITWDEGVQCRAFLNKYVVLF